MLHLRLIVPADRTDEVLHLVEHTVGTTHLVVLPGPPVTRRAMCCWSTWRARRATG